MGAGCGVGGDKAAAFRAKAYAWGRGLQKGLGIPGESRCCMVPTLAGGGKPGGM